MQTAGGVQTHVQKEEKIVSGRIESLKGAVRVWPLEADHSGFKSELGSLLTGGILNKVLISDPLSPSAKLEK